MVVVLIKNKYFLGNHDPNSIHTKQCRAAKLHETMNHQHNRATKD